MIRETVPIYELEAPLIRLGRLGDGGYLIPADLASGTLISIGIGNEVSFELDFLSQCEEQLVYMFDHSVNDPTSNLEISKLQQSRIKFFKLGVSSSDHRSDFTTLIDIIDLVTRDSLEEGKPMKLTDTVLKIDVEWNEWEVFKQLLDSSNGKLILSELKLLIIEFHFFFVQDKANRTPYFTNCFGEFYHKVNNRLLDEYLKILRELQSFLFCYHIHPNNSIGLIDLGGFSIPQLIEFGFVNKRYCLEPRVSTRALPILGLDYPNKADRPDIYLEEQWRKGY